MILEDRYYRRCASCSRPYGDEQGAEFGLPKLKKSVMYVDQFALSEMVKSSNPTLCNGRSVPAASFWKDLFARLTQLVAQQRLVCPSTESHLDESLLRPDYFRALHGILLRLSTGIKFHNYGQILSMQVLDLAGKRLGHECSAEDLFDPQRATSGKIHGWQPRTQFYASWWDNADYVEPIRERRREVQKRLERVFERWRTETEFGFDRWFAEESSELGRWLILELDGVKSGPLWVSGLAQALQKMFKTHVRAPHDWMHELRQFIVSKEYIEAPALRLNAGMWAALANKAAHAGQKKPPDEGMSVDVDAVSSLLPYCDVMFVDRACYSIVSDIPDSRKVDHGTMVVSMSQKDELLAWLAKLESSTTRDHLDAVEDVYDDEWIQRFHQ